MISGPKQTCSRSTATHQACIEKSHRMHGKEVTAWVKQVTTENCKRRQQLFVKIGGISAPVENMPVGYCNTPPSRAGTSSKGTTGANRNRARTKCNFFTLCKCSSLLFPKRNTEILEQIKKPPKNDPKKKTSTWYNVTPGETKYTENVSTKNWMTRKKLLPRPR